MWVDNYHWHYDYARLAWDTGFSFDKYKYANLDKNKICLIDIERTIRERDVASVDRNISTVVQYVLENDQAEVLDTNFVKLFRLSQLSVEYLLFCKKYLDRTVVLLKKEVIKLKEEVKELKIYTEELETQVSSSKNTPVVSFKCEICSKLFSSEDYLNSHFKKKHNGVDNKINGNSEAEKLHSEIKELKERLNNTEKFIQEKPFEREIDKSHIKEDYKDADDKTTKLVCEIQESFEKFRKQVEEKMCGLQSEKNFFTEKYDKLFEIVLQYKNREQEAVKIEEPKIKVAEYPKIENTTQTSVEYEDKKNKTKNLQVYTVQHDNIIDIVKTESDQKTSIENIDEKIERKLSNFEENIESKISSGLGNIENQIQAFWVKLSEVELNHPQTGDHPVDQQIVKENSPQNKPKIKPRTKLTKQTVEQENKNAELIKNELEKILAIKSKPESNRSQVKFESNSDLKPTVVKSAVSNMYESSTTEEELSVEEEDKNYDFSENLKGSKPDVFESGKTLVKNKNFSVTPKSSIGKNLPEKSSDLAVKKSKSSIMKIALPEKSSTLVKKVDVRDNEKAKKKMRKQLNDVIDASLQEMGISPHWKGIPKKSFERALEIVNHQAFLSKKSLPEYDSLKKSIEKSLNNNKELKKVKEKGQPIVTRDSPNRKKPKHNTVKFQIRKHLLPQQESKPDSAVTIKNRSLYDSESETDIKTYLPKNFEQKQVHSAVIEELQLKFSEKTKHHQDTDSVSDLNSIILSNGENEEIKDTKSALKSFVSSETAFVKKKVFFDVDSDRKKEPGDVRKKEDIEKKKKDENSSVSDFEFTD